MSFEQKLLRGIRVLTLVGIVAGAIVLWIVQWWFTRPEKQPIAFSHQVHAGQRQISCFFCHTGVQHGNIAGVISVQDCMQCHQVINPSNNTSIKPEYAREILKLTNADSGHPGYWERKQPIRWAKVYKMPKTVQFSHKVHVAFLSKGNPEALSDPGKTICVKCHGNIAEMRTVGAPTNSIMLLTGNMNPNTSMGFCVECHRVNNGPMECTACHR